MDKFSLCFECRKWKLNELFNQTPKNRFHICTQCKEMIAQRKKDHKKEVQRFNNLLNRCINYNKKKEKPKTIQKVSLNLKFE